MRLKQYLLRLRGRQLSGSVRMMMMSSWHSFIEENFFRCYKVFLGEMCTPLGSRLGSQQCAITWQEHGGQAGPTLWNQAAEPVNDSTEPLKYRTRGPEAGPALEGGLRQPSSLARTIYLCMSALKSIHSASLSWGASEALSENNVTTSLFGRYKKYQNGHKKSSPWTEGNK